jgi:hypothetical protein
MKAYEFPAKLTTEGKLEFSDAILKQLPINQELKIIILVKEATDIEEDEQQQNTAWRRLAAEQFFADYKEEEAIYDQI